MHVVYDLLQAADPLFRLLRTGCHEVQIFLGVIEDDGEAAVFITGVGAFIEPLRLTAMAH